MLLLHVDIKFMVLSWRYLGHSGDTVVTLKILNSKLRLEIDIGKIFTKVVSLYNISKESRVW